MPTTGRGILLVTVLLTAVAVAQEDPAARLWRDAGAQEKGVMARVFGVFQSRSARARDLQPRTYREFDLDREALAQLLSEVDAARVREPMISPQAVEPSALARSPQSVPEQRTQTVRTEITIPFPDGAIRRFEIEDSQTMSPQLARKYPQIRSFRGRSIDDGTPASLRLDIAPTGFHAYVIVDGAIVVIDPLMKANDYLRTSSRYASFRKEHSPTRDKQLECATEGVPIEPGAARPAPTPDVSWGTEVRTYRLAVMTTGEYTRAVGGTTEAALAAVERTVNRVNEIYGRDLAIHLQLIPETDQLFQLSPMPHIANSDAHRLIVQAQEIIDRTIGSSAYDIGHAFSTGAGGLATLASVMRDGLKARGVTGSARPWGDPFDVDYVAHEMGHQFGANHSFNGRNNACAGRNWNALTAYEPGSGSTILSYAGICGPDDVQANSDAYFHGVSLHEIVQHASGAGDTQRRTPTRNRVPLVTARAAATVPVGTPFALTAEASDDDGDSLTYVWEQFDLGAQCDLSHADDGNIPLFRSMPPTSSAVRSFPAKRRAHFGNLLPRVGRQSAFRVTVRDNHGAAGAIASATTRVAFVAEAGPFRVTHPGGGSVAPGPVTVRWDVANTDRSPVGVSQVRLLASSDGGDQFALLVAVTANDGLEDVQLPASAGPVVIRVESIGNVFFADSAPFRVQ